MSSNCSPKARSCVAVAGLALIHARLLPWLSTVRRSSKVTSWSNPASSSHRKTSGVASNSALTSVRAQPSRITLTSARPPVTSCSASTRMDLPAPVSPVKTVKPSANSRSSSLTMTKSRRTMRLRLTWRSLLRSSAIFPAGCQSKTNLWGVKTARGDQIAPLRCGHRASGMPATAGQNWRWHPCLKLIQ